jgi:3-hydroxyisobutyrate dehydrogenase
MGSAMTARLAETGAPVLVWNRDPDVPRKAGFDVTKTPRELAERCDTVISSLFDDAVVKAVFEGADGLIAGGAGKLFVEMSTVRRDRGFPIRDLSWGA